MEQEGRKLFDLFHEVCLTKPHCATEGEHAQAVTTFWEWTKESMNIRKKFFD